MIAAIVTGGAAFAAGYLIAEPFDPPDLGPMFRALAPSPVISALTASPIAVVTRRMLFSCTRLMFNNWVTGGRHCSSRTRQTPGWRMGTGGTDTRPTIHRRFCGRRLTQNSDFNGRDRTLGTYVVTRSVSMCQRPCLVRQSNSANYFGLAFGTHRIHLNCLKRRDDLLFRLNRKSSLDKFHRGSQMYAQPVQQSSSSDKRST